MRSIRPYLSLIMLGAAALACTLGAPPATIPAAPTPTPSGAAPTATGALPTEASQATPTAPATETAVGETLLAVHQPNGEVVLVALDGETRPLAAAPRTFYALVNLGGDPNAPAYALGPDGARHLDFIQGVSPGFAAWTDPASGETRLAWDQFTFDGASAQVTSHIYVGDPEGVQARAVLTETATQPPQALRVVGWSADGTRLFYSQEPVGLGGYLLFGGLTNLWAFDWQTGATEVVWEGLEGGFICGDDFTEDLTRVAHHCGLSQISVQAVGSGSPDAVLPPPEVAAEAGVLGRARFSPGADRLAFGVARNDPENEQGWVAVSDTLSGPARLVATADPGEYFDVIDWLDDDTLLLQSSGVVPGVWLVDASGSDLRRVAEGRWLATLR